jgi:hypothetical protein
MRRALSDVARQKEARLRRKLLRRAKVGATGFEPATSSSRTKRATGLRYAPNKWKTVNLRESSQIVNP